MNHPIRRMTRPVQVGDLTIGGEGPIVIQSMTTSDTLDTDRVVGEIAELVGAGCPLVRLTVPNVRAAENLPIIRSRLAERGLDVPLVADIHFTPAAAMVAAEHCEKVRINPGNFVDRKRFAVRDYSDAEYADELARLSERFTPLVFRLKERRRALRIGTNHGSLSDRILNRYGDTPEGMVESALEFVRICRSLDFDQIVLSIKSSIPSVMIAANRLLVRRLIEEGFDHPIHLGVTEAGNHLSGRVKSAIGIGVLLREGIGETIRVSLTEDSVHEIEAGRAILAAVEQQQGGMALPSARWAPPDPIVPGRAHRRSIQIGPFDIGPKSIPRVEIELCNDPADPLANDEAIAEAIRLLDRQIQGGGHPPAEIIAHRLRPTEGPSRRIDPLDRFQGALTSTSIDSTLLLEFDLRQPGEIHVLEPLVPYLAAIGARFLVDGQSDHRVALLARLARARKKPIRFRLEPDATPLENWPERAAAFARRIEQVCSEQDWDAISFVVSGEAIIATARAVRTATDSPLFLELPGSPAEAAIVAGSLLLDGIGDAIRMTGPIGTIPGPDGGIEVDPVALGYTILQACRLRLTRAEFIACPSCGRTQFDLQTTTARIMEKTGHLRGVKIAIMGCIVNGPGEMADADFGYVGSGPGKVDLYVGRERVRRGLPAEKADEHLIDLIREHRRWIDPNQA